MMAYLLLMILFYNKMKTALPMGYTSIATSLEVMSELSDSNIKSNRGRYREKMQSGPLHFLTRKYT